MLKFCRDCIHAKPKQGMKLDYCGKHQKWVTKYTIINRYEDDKECKDYSPREGTECNESGEHTES